MDSDFDILQLRFWHYEGQFTNQLFENFIIDQWSKWSLTIFNDH